MNKISNQKGFTLIELLAVVGIIGILFAFLMPNLGSFQGKSNNGVVESDMRLIKNSLQEHYVDFPSELLTKSRIEGYLGHPVEQTSAAGSEPTYYTTNAKKDTWGTPYEIIVGNTPETFIAVHSFGPNAVSNFTNGGIGADIQDDLLVLFYPLKE